jgi:hypothetical protein
MGRWRLAQFISLGFDPEFADKLSQQGLSRRDMWRLADLRGAIIARYGGQERAAMLYEALDGEGRAKLQAQLDELDRDVKLRAKLDPIAPLDEESTQSKTATPQDDELLRVAKELGIEVDKEN